MQANEAGFQSDVPSLFLIVAGNASPICVQEFSEEGTYVVGNSQDTQMHVAIEGMSPQHFSIERGPTYCLLKPQESVFLNGRKIEFPVLLAAGDELKAGEAVFTFTCPTDGSFPCLRIADTFWVSGKTPDNWEVSAQIGFYRHLRKGFVENISFIQDEVIQKPLQQYLDEQFKYMAHATDDFSTKSMLAAQLYRAEACAMHNHDFVFQGQRICQYQFFALKGEALGIASWTTPAGQANNDGAPDAFNALLQSIYFG